MDRLTKDQVKQLVEYTNDTCISIYMPTFRKGSETQQNAIRFKNLVARAEHQLQQLSLREEQITKLLEPARNLQNDFDFWQHQCDCLAFFRSPDILQTYCLPAVSEELVVVAGRFHIKPLLSVLNGDGRFYLLALDLNQVRLLDCTRFSASEIDLGNIPQSLSEALKFDEPQQQLQFHTGAGRGSGGRAAVFHGQGKGVGNDDAERKKNILRFFQQLDNGVTHLLTDKSVPLVLAGVEYLIPLYREANSYATLMNKAILHNPQELSNEKLLGTAWEVMAPHFHQTEKKAAKKYWDLARSGKTSTDLKQVVRESYNKRVESLFVREGQKMWGVFDRNNDSVVLHKEAQPGDDDLLDLAAAQTLTSGGSVYVITSENMPDQAEVAAVYRF